jgi:hypothetical protein
MIGTWYVPSWTGDFRLEGDEDVAKSVLTVTDPTDEEWVRLNRFLATARSKGWIETAEGVVRRGETRLVVGASVHMAGRELASELEPRKGVLTVVASEGGAITGVVDGTQLPDPKVDLPPEPGDESLGFRAARLGKTPSVLTEIKDGEHDEYIGDFIEAERKGKSRSTVISALEERFKLVHPDADVPGAPKPESAVTVRRPTLCCPTPIDGAEVRASQVLQAFCDPTQWSHWLEHGWLVAYGKYTGHAYRVCHRHTPLAKRQGKITMDLDDGVIVHCYDWSVPPPEEVLAIKLILEHREDWLRNSSTLWDAPLARHIFRNPLGDQVLDGTKDAALVSTVGSGVLGGVIGGLLGGL